MKRFAPVSTAFFRSAEFGWIVVAALGLWLAFPNPLGQIPALGLLFPIGLARLAFAGNKKRVFRLSWLTGLLGNAACLYWVALPPHDFGGLPWIVAVPFPLLLAAYIALYAGFFSLCARAFLPLPLLLRATALGCLWVCLEYLRGWLFTGFPWLSLSTAFAAWPICAQGASLFGAYGLSGLLVCCALLAGLPSARPWLHKGAALAIAALLVGYGAYSLNTLPEGEAGQARRPVLLVQGNIDQHTKWTRESVASAAREHIRLTEAGLAQNPGIDFAIWAETAVPFSLRDERSLAQPLLAFVRSARISLLTGAPGFTPPRPGKEPDLENRAELITPQGINGFYAKEHLVPFGEYVPPFLDFAFLAFALQEIGRFTPGTQKEPLYLPDGPALGALICYEAIFPELAAERVASGAQVLVNISNDAWFGRSPAMLQHLQQAAMRSIEQRRWLLRATSNGLTAIVDAGGRVVSIGPSHTAAVLPGEFAPRSGLSVFQRIRAFVPPFCFVVLLIAILARRYYIKR